MGISTLIVDDSPAMRRFIRRTLELTGLDMDRLLEAANGKEALEILRRERVDLVLTDINMPSMNGEEFVAEVEADANLRSIPVVVVSTDSTQQAVRRMIQLGARGYVAKPFEPEILREELERVLGVGHE
ncbi:MAG: response regulator [Bryobacteraceae bacterium]|nr:response regulator [Bryobacteraceae bacterium]